MEKFQPKIKLNGKNGGLSFAVLMAVYVVISFVGQMIAEAAFGKGSTAFIIVCSAFSSVSLLLVVLLFTVWANNDFLSVVPIKKFSPLYLFIALLLSVGMFMGLGFVNDAFATFLGAWGLNVSGLTVPLENVGNLIIFIILYAVLPAITEELFFRGLLLDTLKNTNRLIACLTVALCFAFYHCSAVQFIYQFVYGFMLCLLAMFAKSVIPCIIVHFLNNFAVLMFEYFKVYVNLYSPIILVIGINLLAGVCTIFYFIYRRKEKPNIQKGETLSFYLPYGLIGLGVSLSLLLSNLLV